MPGLGGGPNTRTLNNKTISLTIGFLYAPVLVPAAYCPRIPSAFELGPSKPVGVAGSCWKRISEKMATNGKKMIKMVDRIIDLSYKLGYRHKQVIEFLVRVALSGFSLGARLSEESGNCLSVRVSRLCI